MPPSPHLCHRGRTYATVTAHLPPSPRICHHRRAYFASVAGHAYATVAALMCATVAAFTLSPSPRLLRHRRDPYYATVTILMPPSPRFFMPPSPRIYMFQSPRLCQRRRGYATIAVLILLSPRSSHRHTFLYHRRRVCYATVAALMSPSSCCLLYTSPSPRDS